MKTYTLKLTEWQFLFLKWVRDGCPKELEEIINANSWFVRAVGYIRNEGLIEWHTDKAGNSPSNEIFKITKKGLAVIELWSEE